MLLLDNDSDIFELSIENLEDLWVLSEILSPGDEVFSKTKRKISIGNDNKKQVTKILNIHLRVSKVFFNSDVLRISGEILNETDYTAIGQSHSLTFKVRDRIKFKKKTFLDFQKKLFDKSLNSKGDKVLIILLDKDELIVFEAGDFSYSFLFSVNNLGSKKGYSNLSINDDEEKYNILSEFLKKDYSKIIIAGPNFFSESFSNYLKLRGINSFAYKWNSVSRSSIEDLILEISNSGLLNSLQISIERDIVNKLLLKLKDGKAVYGFDNVLNSANQGAISDLLVSTKFINKFRDDENFQNLFNLMEIVEKMSGNVKIISSKNDSGKILDGISGIAGILRF